MRVIFFVSGPVDPAARFRVYNYIPYLEAAGVECHVNVCRPGFYEPPRFLKISPGYHALNARKIASRIPGIVQASSCDVAVVQRELIPYNSAFLERRISRLRRPACVYDFDDAVYLNYGAADSPKNKIVQTIRAADLVIGGNRNLVDYSRRFNPNAELLPTAVPASAARPPSCTETGRSTGPGNPFVIGWTGTTSTLPYLDIVTPALLRLLKRNQNLVIRIMSNWDGPGSPQFSFPAEFIRWSPEIEPQVLSTFHCGLMPLTDDEWSRSKCSLKALMYFAAGIPAVVSPVGSNVEIVSDNTNGFWAASTEEWESRIQQLIDSQELRERFVKAGAETLRLSYSTEACSKKMLELFHEAVANKRRRGTRLPE